MSLKKHGREYQANCPFHNEKTPSFTVSDEKGFYHCFGCGAHGDVIGFIKEFEGLGYVQAVESLAREAGIPLPEVSPRERQVYDLSEKIYQAMELSAQYFTHQLHRPSNGHALDYIKKRGISDEMLHQFRIGYATSERHGLQQFLNSKGIDAKVIAEAGLLSTPDSGQPYDKFRDRLIFPIRDVGGRVIAFGGRTMKTDASGPKYLNSPETVLFNKSHVLYNLDLARKAAARGGKLIIAEGYMDVMALAQGGFTHAVAPLGTAVTEHHLAMAWQMADEPVMCLDGDAAGLKAMQRAMELALPHLKPAKSLSFCLLPQGEDPDSFLKRKGQGAMQEALTRAIPLVEMLWRKYYGGEPMHTPEKRAAAKTALLDAVALIKDKAVQQAYREEMNKRLWEASRPTQPARNTTFTKGAKGAPANAKPAAKLTSGLPGNLSAEDQQAPLQQQILTLFLVCPELLGNDDAEGILENLIIHHGEWDALRHALQDILAMEILPLETAMLGRMLPEEVKPVARKMLVEAKRNISFVMLSAKAPAEKLLHAHQTLLMAVERLQSFLVHQEVTPSFIDQVASGEGQMDKVIELHSESRRLHNQNFFMKKEDSTN